MLATFDENATGTCPPKLHGLQSSYTNGNAGYWRVHKRTIKKYRWSGDPATTQAPAIHTSCKDNEVQDIIVAVTLF